MRPEHAAGFGYRLQHLEEGVRSSLLSNIYIILQSSLNETDLNEFSIFYKQMLGGLSPEEREKGAEPKSVQELVEWIDEKDISGSIKDICLTLAKLMAPPEPLEF